MATAELSRCVEKVIGYPPLSELGDLQRRELHEALLDADSSRTCPESGSQRSSRRNRTGRTCGSCRTTSPIPVKSGPADHGFEGFPT